MQLTVHVECKRALTLLNSGKLFEKPFNYITSPVFVNFNSAKNIIDGQLISCMCGKECGMGNAMNLSLNDHWNLTNSTIQKI